MKNKIIINGQNVNLQKCGGVGRYVEQLYLRSMSLNNALFSTPVDISFINFERRSMNKKKSIINYIKLLASPVASNFFSKFSQRRNNELSLFDNIRGKIIFHEATNYNTAEEIGRLCLSLNTIFVVTFIDIQDFFYKEYFNDKQLSHRRLSYSFYKEHADCFFSISNFTKETMINRLNIPEEKIIVTHLAADDLSLNEHSEEIKKWALSFGRYWIYPAKAWIHKNHIFLFESLGKIREFLYIKKIKFLLTGGFNNNDIKYLQKIIYDNKLSDIVHILGFVSDEQLQALITYADYLIFPSLFEGFGMPVLEAMKLGCPVVSSNVGALPEVCGDAAVYFDPKNKKKFAELLESLLFEKNIDRNSMIKKGFNNCNRFSWDITFKKTIEVYKKLLQ